MPRGIPNDPKNAKKRGRPPGTGKVTVGKKRGRPSGKVAKAVLNEDTYTDNVMVYFVSVAVTEDKFAEMAKALAMLEITFRVN